MSELTQRFLDQLNAGQTIPFRHRPSNALVMGLSMLLPVLAIVMTGVVLPYLTGHQIPLDAIGIFIIVIFSAAALYQFKNAITRPTIIALSLASFDYQGNIVAWTAVARVRIVVGRTPVLSIYLQTGHTIRTRFSLARDASSRIQIGYTPFEYPTEFVACIKACAGERYEGMFTVGGARRGNDGR
jgi:hypothetical protein